MRRLIVSVLWVFGISWLVIWGVSALVGDSMPTGVIWASFSMIVWWFVGGTSREDSAGDN